MDTIVQGLRDFIIDSQLMQDFDDPSQPTHNANGVARYQTHLTLVDDQKAPLAKTPVKPWAELPGTAVLVNGQTYTIGPDDDQCAAVMTGSDGTLVIATGSVMADGSDKPDMSAALLRAWANFMDPYERMLIFRDREFHNRVAAAHATDADQSGADDPTRPNLKTAQIYGDLQNQGKTVTVSTDSTIKPGGTLFNQDEMSQGQPTQIANCIQTMTTSAGTAPPPGNKTLKAAFALHATEVPGKYVAYTNTPGAQYSPVNVAANRAAVVLQSAGLSFSTDDPKNTPRAYSSMTPAEATMAIDALDGRPWHSSEYASPRLKAAAATGTLHLGNFLDDFWNWIKNAVATVTHIIVSVAEDIYAGFRVLIDDVAYVFQTIVTGIEQIASAIGSFFIALAKEIEQIIEALSILFQFGHIMDTHRLLKQELLDRINGKDDDKTNYPGIADAITNNVMQPLDDFFKQGEQAINDAFNKVADQIAGQSQSVRGLGAADSGGPALNGIKGSGSTAHSTFTVQPSGGGASASTSPQAMWGTQKLQAGIGGGHTGSTLSVGLRGAASLGDVNDSVNSFFPTFLARLTGDGDLSSEWAKLQSGASGLGSASSPGDFMRQAIAELIRAVALLLDGALAVSNAFLDGFLGVIGGVVPVLMDPNTGLLNQELDIPVLSWLYNLLFGEPLTVINALTLVAAIPVTLIWRIAKGAWPAGSVGAAKATALLGASQLLVEIMSITGGIAAIIYAFLCAISDGSSLFSSVLGKTYPPEAGTNNLKEVMAYFYIAAALVGAAVFFPLLTNTGTPTPESWASWGVALAIPPVSLLGLPPFTVLNDVSDETKALLPKVVSCVICALNLTLLGIAIGAYVKQVNPNLANELSFAANLAATVPGLLNPLTAFGGVTGELIVAALDLIMGLLAGALLIASAIESAQAVAPESSVSAAPAAV